jgi:hypothetical protein
MPGPGDSRAAQKAGPTPFDAQQVLARTALLPVGAGTGGGDMAEVEPNDTMLTANASRDLPFNCTGTIATNGDEDVLAVPMVAGVPIEVNVFAQLEGGINSPLDPTLVVRTAETVIAEDDDAVPGERNAQVNFVASTTETLYIVVGSHGGLGGPDFDYVVMVLPVTGNAFDHANYEAEPNQGLEDANEIVPPGVRTGEVRPHIGGWTAGDPDVFYFDAPAGATAVIDLSSRIFGYWAGTRTSVAFLAPDGTPVSGAGPVSASELDPRFNIKIPETGRYYLVVDRLLGGMPLPPPGTKFNYLLSVTLQDGGESPNITDLQMGRRHPKKLWAIIGSGFDMGGMLVEISGRAPFTGLPSPESPTTAILVKPHLKLAGGEVFTVVRANGRRSNYFVHE